MNVLILGAGAREHALAVALAKSPRLQRLYIAPGNGGAADVAETVALDVEDHAAIVAFCKSAGVEFVVVGPEAPLVAGVVDHLEAAGVAAFGPSANAARLEGSKGFTKDFCRRFGVPTADYRLFDERASALAYVRERAGPIVVKADGLAAGKGVVVAETLAEAEAAIGALYAQDERAACVVEERLEGEEVSYFALCDGVRAAPFGDAQDHKRLRDGDLGPNTGGMGAFSPSPLVTPAMARRIMSEIVEPTLRGMQEIGAPFRGVLFAGLMMTRTGPKLIEYNVRFGDPETEALLPRFEGDLLDWLWRASRGSLSDETPPFSSDHALSVVMAAAGYPEAPRRGDAIVGLERAQAVEGAFVFHAGTARRGAAIVANGGRVLAVTGMGSTLAEARARAYAAVDEIRWPGAQYRSDIGAKA